MRAPRSIQTYIAILFSFCVSSCLFIDRSQHLSGEVSFELSDWILHESETRCVDFDNLGNAWIGAGTKLVQFESSGGTKSWLVGSEIYDIAVAPGGEIWMGTRDSGLVCFDDGDLIYYTVENSSFPRNWIAEVKAAADGTIWFTSCAHRLGGLMRFYDGNFELFTPENSILNQNIVSNLTLDLSGNLYFSSAGTVGKSNVYRISGEQWYNLGDVEGTFYWVSVMDVSYTGELYLVEDFSLSSSMQEDKLYVYSDKDWHLLETDFDLGFLRPLVVDRRGYLWMLSYSGESPILHVYDGMEWEESEKGQFPESYIRTIQVDKKNSIWLCTVNGVMILEQ